MDTENNATKKAVQGNAEKYDLFKLHLARFKKARQQEFYFEMLWILYAMFEDRTSAFLYYIGFVTENRQKVVAAKNIQQSIRGVLGFGEKANVDFGTLNNKTTAIKKATAWAQKGAAADDFQKELKVLMNRKPINSPEFVKFLDEIDYWRNKRNELTHALFSVSNYETVKDLKPLTEQGYELARALDKAVGALRLRSRKNNIREKFNLK